MGKILIKSFWGDNLDLKNIELLKRRRSYYEIDDNINIDIEDIEKAVKDVLYYVPDAVNMQSQRAVVVAGDFHKKLWDNIHDEFEGKLSREKADSFKNGPGTILFFYDDEVVDKYRKKYEKYADQFESWALQSLGMAQINVWTTLRELGLGASLQHYNPVIDKMVKEMFDIPDDWILVSQMVYGNILEEPDKKEKLGINKRVKVFK